MLFVVASCFPVVVEGQQESSHSRQQPTRHLPQHSVPPFGKFWRDSNRIPSPRNTVLHNTESVIQEDVFYSIVVEKEIGKSSRPQRAAESGHQDATTRTISSLFEQHATFSHEDDRKSLLRGWWDAAPVPKLSSDNSGGPRNLESTGWTESESGYVVTTELDYSSSNSSDADAGNSTDDDIDDSPSAGFEGNTTSDEAEDDTEDDSSSVVTKAEPNNSTNTTTNPSDQPQQGNSTETADPGPTEGDPGGDNEDDNSKLYHPIRIRAVIFESHGGGEHLEPGQLQILLEEIVRPGLLAWSEALRVPVSDLTQNLTLDPQQWPDKTTCGPGLDSGLPTAHVPYDHLVYGVPDTDLVVYLNLGFVQPSSGPTQGGTPFEGTGPSTQRPTIAPTSATTDTPTMNSSTVSPTLIGALHGSTTQPSASMQPSAAPSASASPGTSLNTSATESSERESGEMPGQLSAHANSASAAPSYPTEPAPTHSPTTSRKPSSSPSEFPSVSPTGTPSATPSEYPSSTPSESPSQSPTTPKPECAGDYLASSIFCSTNELDRPTAAMLHVCIGPDFFEPKHLNRNILVVLHEVGHALGFNAESMAHFRRPDGTPITPRNSEGAIDKTLVECTGPQGAGARPKGMLTLPSPEILQFRTVRGGVRVAEVVTPSVVQVVRNHFDCQRLEGAELESGEFLPLSTNPGEISCLGDHWERRLFKMDLMNPIVDELQFDPLISTLTLAYFADSGWYQVDLSRAAASASWGRGAGCAFVEEPCITDTGDIVPGSDSLFCNSLSNINSQGIVTTLDGCTPDLTKKAACTMSKYEGELPPEYQYFPNTYGSNVGGLDPFMDYCPVYNGLKNGLCTDPNNAESIRVSRTERIGSRNSRCLSSHASNAYEVEKTMALCLRIACVVEDKSLRVQVDGKWPTCQYKGQHISTSANGEKIICPDPVRVCPTFYCPRDCLGTNQVCDYTRGACVCRSIVNGEPLVSNPPAGGNCQDLGNAPSGPGNGGNDDKDPPDGGTPPDGGGSYTPPTTESPLSNFYIPPEEADADPSVPQNGSALDDIYFPNERTLAEQADEEDAADDNLRGYRSDPGEWRLALISVLVLMLPLIYFYTQHLDSESAGTDDANDGDGDAPAPSMNVTQRRNKEKMIANVLVDLRINDMSSFRDVLVQRDSMTDRSMTDTDGGTFIPWEDQLSARDFPSTVESVASSSYVAEPTIAILNDESSIPPSAESSPTHDNSTIRRRFFRRRNGTDGNPSSPARTSASSDSESTPSSRRRPRLFRRRNTTRNNIRQNPTRIEGSGLGGTVTL